MSKTEGDKVELEGVVKAPLPGGYFEVEITQDGFEGVKVRARLSGKMRMNYIRVIPGDLVIVQISATNLNEGIITFRQK